MAVTTGDGYCGKYDYYIFIDFISINIENVIMKDLKSQMRILTEDLGFVIDSKFDLHSTLYIY